MLLLMREIPLSPFPPPLLGKLLLILKDSAPVPLLLETLLIRLISLRFPICGLLSQPGSLSCPSTPACSLVQPAHEKVRALKVRASGLHLSPQPRPIPSAVPGRDGRQAVFVGEREEGCRHTQTIQQTYPGILTGIFPVGMLAAPSPPGNS